VIDFPGTCTDPKVANAKKIPHKRKISSENLSMEYMEYAVTVTSYWDEEFVQKFSTKSKSLHLVLLSCQKERNQILFTAVAGNDVWFSAKFCILFQLNIQLHM
jgi:hypothetical protein